MADERIEIELTLDNKKFKTTLNQSAESASKKGSEAGNNFSTGFLNSFKSGSVAIVGAATAAAAAIGAALASRAVINASIKQEEAVNRLNTSLRSSGDFSIEASRDLQAFAAQIEKLTTVGDEAAISGLALAKSFGATNEQAKQVVSAAADLSAQIGIDFETAVRQVSKTLGGYSGELGEVIPALKGLTTEQLRNAEGARLISKFYSGSAVAATKTYQGAIDQLRNAIGTVLENIGGIVTKSVPIRAIINTITKLIQKLGDSTSGLNFDSIFDAGIRGAIFLARSLTESVIPAFELLFNIGSVIKNSFKTLFAGIALGAVKGLEPIVNLADRFGVGGDVVLKFREFKKEASAEFKETSENAKKAFDGVFDFEFTKGVSDGIDEIERLYKESTKEILDTQKKLNSEASNNKIDKSLFVNVEEEKKAAEELKKQQQEIVKTLRNTIDQINLAEASSIGKLSIQLDERNKKINEALKIRAINESEASRQRTIIEQDFARQAEQLRLQQFASEEERFRQSQENKLNLLNEFLQKRVISEQQFNIYKRQIDEQEQEFRINQLAQQEVAFEGFNEKFRAGLEANAKTSKVTFQQLAASATNIFSRGVGKAFQDVGGALANGENAWKAFGNAIIGVLGELVSAFGDSFIRIGIGRTLLGDPSGPALIAAGAALKVLSGVFGAKAGGIGGAGSGVTDSGNAGGIPVVDVARPVEEQDRREPQQVVNLNVNGDIFDTEDTRKRLVDLLNESFEADGTRLVS